jgi:hypothetical protein
MADVNPFARFATDVPGTVADDNPFKRFAPSGTAPDEAYYDQFARGSGDTVQPFDGPNGRSVALTRPPSQPQSWGQWIKSSIAGEHDPAFSNLPSVYSEEPKLLENPMGMAATLGASDEQMADVVKKQLGDRYIDTLQDANGYPVIKYRDETGKEKLGYVNRPGLDSEDVVRGIRGSLPYAAAAEVLGPIMGGASLGPRLLATGATGGGLSVAGDEAMKPLGNEHGVDTGKAATMAILPPVAEAAGSAASRMLTPLYQRFIAEPRYFSHSTGQLTPLGRQTAQQMGLDPDQLASDAMATFGKTYAMSPADAKAMVDAGSLDFNIPVSRGQLAKDPQQLLQEKAMRSGLYGLPAKQQIEDLDHQQADAISKAVTETLPERFSGMRGARLADSPDAYGNNIGMNLSDAQVNAKAAEKAAWDSAQDIMPLPGATHMLPQAIGNRLSKLSVFDDISTPTAYRMGEQIQSFIDGKAPTTKLDATLGISRPQTVDALRKQLAQLRGNAQTSTDQAAASAIYHGYNDWIDQAAQANLLAGDPLAAVRLKAARDVSAQIRSVFNPVQGGRLSPGGKILQEVSERADTPERIVSALLPSPNAEIRPGTIEALRLIKARLGRYGQPDAERQTWAAIKLAYLQKLTQGRDGRILSPGVMATNIRKAMNAHATLFNSLYEPADRATLRRFLAQLDKVTWKDPNPSGTATGVANLTKQLFGTLLDSFGGLGRAIWDFSGVQHAWGSNLARRAVAQNPPKIPFRPIATNAGRLALPLSQPIAQQQQ